MEVFLVLFGILLILIFLKKIISLIGYLISLPFKLVRHTLVFCYLITSLLVSKIVKPTTIKYKDYGSYRLIILDRIGLEYYQEILRFLLLNYINIISYPDRSLIERYDGFKRKDSTLYNDGVKRLLEFYKKSVKKGESPIRYKNLRYIKKFSKSTISSSSLFYMLEVRYNEKLDVYEDVYGDEVKSKTVTFVSDGFKSKELIGVDFNDSTDILNQIIRPELGYLENFSENKFHFFVSLGYPIDDIYKKKPSYFDTKHSFYIDSYCSNFKKPIFLNVGYDNDSYIIYMFDFPRLPTLNFKKSDRLVFKGENGSVFVGSQIEYKTFDGLFEFKTNSDININGSIKRLNDLNEFSFYMIRITIDDIDNLLKIGKFKIYYYTGSEDNYYELSEGTHYWNNSTNNEDVFRFLLELLPTDLPFNELSEIEKRTDDSVYVYLMRDNNSSYYKIGISNNPKFRERTLLSQSPDIELIEKREFLNRELSLTMEKTLHNHFSSKRVRGEWFDLNDNDIIEFCSILGI